MPRYFPHICRYFTTYLCGKHLGISAITGHKISAVTLLHIISAVTLPHIFTTYLPLLHICHISATYLYYIQCHELVPRTRTTPTYAQIKPRSFYHDLFIYLLHHKLCYKYLSYLSVCLFVGLIDGLFVCLIVYLTTPPTMCHELTHKHTHTQSLTSNSSTTQLLSL